jgi:hypothetical protein
MGERNMKVWIISLKGENNRIKLRAYAQKDDAIAEMGEICETLNRQLHHTDVQLERVGNLLIVTFYDEDETNRYEKAVMTELDVVEAFTLNKPVA